MFRFAPYGVDHLPGGRLQTAENEFKVFMLRSLSPFTPVGGFATEDACLEYVAHPAATVIALWGFGRHTDTMNTRRVLTYLSPCCIINKLQRALPVPFVTASVGCNSLKLFYLIISTAEPVLFKTTKPYTI